MKKISIFWALIVLSFCFFTGGVQAAFTLSGSIITQSGTDTDLTGLSSVSGVSTLTSGSGTNIFTTYHVGNRQLRINGTLTLDPTKEQIIFGENAPANTVIVSSGGIFNFGIDKTVNGEVLQTTGKGIIVPRTLVACCDSGAFVVQNGGRLNWKGATLQLASVMNWDAGSTVNITNGRIINTRGSLVRIRSFSTALNVDGLVVEGGDSIDFFQPPVSFSGYEPGYGDRSTEAISAGSGGSNNPYVFNGYKSKGLNYDFSSWNGADIKLVSIDAGSAVDVIVGPTNISNSIARVYKEIALKIMDDTGAGIEGVQAFIRDTDNGNRNNTVPRSGVDYTVNQDKTYLHTTNTTGDIPSFEVLTAFKYPSATIRTEGGYNYMSTVTDRRGKGNDNNDTFDIHLWSYSKRYSSITQNLKGEGVLSLDWTLFNDPSISEMNQGTVDAYTSIDTLEELYDRAKSWKVVDAHLEYPTVKTPLLTVTKGILDLGDHNLVIDPTAAEVFSVNQGTKTITITTSALSAGSLFNEFTTTGSVTYANGAIQNTPYTDSTGYHPVDSIAPVIAIVAPTKTANSVISDTTIRVTDNRGITSGNVSIDASSTSAVSGFSCVQTSTTQVDCTLQIASTGDLQVKATDVFGNNGTQTEVGYIVNSTPLTVTINQAGGQPDPSSTYPVRYTVVFSEPINNSTFTTGDILTTGSSAPGVNVNTITELAPNNQTVYQVEISGSGSGNILANIASGAVQTPSSAGNVASSSTDNTIQVKLDSIDPVVSITAPTKVQATPITNTTIQVTDNVGIMAGNVSISPLSTAVASNLNCTQTSTAEVNCTISVSGQGLIVIEAVDADGNDARALEGIYTVDTIPPTLIANVNINAPFDKDNPEFTFSATDNIAIDHFEISLDGGAFTTQASPYTPTLATLASHTVTIRAIDASGNTAETTIDFPPAVVITSPTTLKNGDITDTSIEIQGPTSITNITISGAGSTFICDKALPALPPIVCTGSVTTSGLLVATATDGVITGRNSRQYTIESVRPDVLINAPTKLANVAITDTTIEVYDDYGLDASNVTVSGSTTATTNSFLCNQVNTSQVTCTINVTASGDLIIQATDNAGNVRSTIESSYLIDARAPAAPTLQNSPEGLEVSNPTILNPVCNEIGEVITISNVHILPNPTLHTCTAVGVANVAVTWSATAPAGSQQTLAITATDTAGNISPPKNVNVYIADGDSADRNTELGALNSGDGNGDGNSDAEQPLVTSIPNTQTQKPNTLEITSANCTRTDSFSVKAEAQLSNNAALDYPVGLWDFQLSCNNLGDSADVKIYLDKVYDTSDWVYTKYNPNTQIYTDISGSVTYGSQNVGGTTVTTVSYTVTDGGPLDTDGVQNGVIIDPAGPGTPPPAPQGGSAPTFCKVPLIQGYTRKQDKISFTFTPIQNGSYWARSLATAKANDLTFTLDGEAIDTSLAMLKHTSQGIFVSLVDKKILTGENIEIFIRNTLSEINTCETKKVFSLRSVAQNIRNSSTNQGFGPIEQIADSSCPSTKYARFPAKRGMGIAAGKFQDARTSHNAYTSLIDLAEQGIVEGDTRTGKARLNDFINRAEMAKLVSIAREDRVYEYECLDGYYSFVDIPQNAWHTNYVYNLASKWILHGYPDGRYKAEQSINAAEAYKIMALSFGYISKSEADQIQYKNKDSEWYEAYQDVLEDKNVIPNWFVGYTPYKKLTRGDVFALLSTVLKEKDKE